MADPTVIAAIRFGYGLPAPAGAASDPAAMLAALRAPDEMAQRYPAAGLDEVSITLTEQARQRATKRGTEAERALYQAVMVEIVDQASRSLRAGFLRALASPDGLRERLVYFWSDHFTVAAKNNVGEALALTMTDAAIRPHVAGRFGDMLRAVTFHPAMLTYLNQLASVGPGSKTGKKKGGGLNENLARELLELHTLGVDASYSQTDVRAMAELLTGLSYSPKQGFGFVASRAQPGAETVLGKTYSGDGLEPIERMLADLALHPATAAHISRKLAVHFLSDMPDAALITRMTRSYLDSGGDLLVVYGTMLEHSAAWAPLGGKARQPYDFILASLRALNLPPAELAGFDRRMFSRRILRPMQAMGQHWTRPRGPDGWPEDAAAWITPQALAARITWAMNVPPQMVTELPAPMTFLERALGPAAGEALRWATARAESTREGVGLVLASAEFNTR